MYVSALSIYEYLHCDLAQHLGISIAIFVYQRCFLPNLLAKLFYVFQLIDNIF